MQLNKHLSIFALLFFMQPPIAGASSLLDETDDGSRFERQLDHLSPELIDSMEQLYHDKIGMFIHWGPYAQIGGAWKGIHNAEWIMRHAKIPVTDYEAVAAKPFNPVEFNAKEWVELCKDAGMGFIIITSKHHDGFAMFDSEHPYNIVDFGDFARDPLAELHRECEQTGIRFGVYYSQSQDWHEPGGDGNGWQGWPPLNQARFEQYYHEKALLQVEELVTRFDSLYMIWFDTPGQFMSPAIIEATMGLVKTHQPHVLINSRIGGGYGHFESAVDEGLMPCVNTSNWKNGVKVPWQTHATVAGSWGYALHNKHLHENAYRPADHFIYKLADIVSKGGVLLLNVAPNELGEIPIGQANLLRRLGQWLEVNGEAIYNADPSPVRNPELPITHKPGKLFFHVKEQVNRELEIIGMKAALKRCYLLRDPTKTALNFSQSGYRISLSLPRDTFVGAQGLAVIAADYEGEIQVSDPTLFADKVGLIELPVSKSTYSNMSISYDQKFGCTHKIAMPWDKGGKSISWKLRVTKPGSYRVISDQAFAPGLEGARYQVLINDQKIDSLPITSKNGRDFIEVEIGSVRFDAVGNYELCMVMLDGARPIKGVSRDKSDQHSEFSLRMIKLRLDI